MEVTHWLATVTQTLQQGAQSLMEFSMPWIHELSIAALAAAVVTLGSVMLLELRALAALRRSVDVHLARVFEQLDLIRYDQVQLLEASTRLSAGVAAPTLMRVRAEAATTVNPAAITAASPAALAPAAVAAGEA